MQLVYEGTSFVGTCPERWWLFHSPFTAILGEDDEDERERESLLPWDAKFIDVHSIWSIHSETIS